MKKMKKILCLCLALAMCLSLVNLTALAVENECPSNPGYSHEYENGICKYCGDGAVCSHPNRKEELTESTCTSAGHKKIFCPDCGAVLQDEECPKLEHLYLDGKCKYCGQDEPKAECEHYHTETVIVGGPICTEPEYKVTKCKDCGEELSKEQCPFPGKHEYDDGKCKYCGQDEPKAEHTHTLEHCGGTPATCELTGMKESWFCTECGEHFLDQDGTKSASKDDLTIPVLEPVFGEWKNNGDGTQTRVCKNCNGKVEGHSETESIGHTHTLEYCKGTPATCELTGMKESWFCTECGEHFWDESGTQSATKEDLTIPALEPVFGEWKNNGDGTQTRVCKNCNGKVEGHSETESIGHTHTLEYCKGTPATCELTGMKESWFCAECGEHFWDESGTQSATKEDLTIPALEPVFDGAKWVPLDSLKHIRYCVNCDGKGELHEETGAHNFNDWYTSKEATCTEDGLKVRECKDCGYKEEQVIPALGHDWGDWQSDGAKGHYQVCSRCESHSDTVSHNFGAWETVREATTTEEGVEQHVCADCGYTETRNTSVIEEQDPGNQGGNEPTRYTLTINYRYADGTEAAAQYSQEFEINASYNVVSPEIAGYSPDVTQVIGEMTGNVTVTVTYSRNVDIDEEDPPLIETPGDRDPIVTGPSETDIPDEQPPLTDIPDEETPTVETPTEETPVPVVDLPDEQPPLVDLPDEQPPLVDLPDEQMPLTDVPMEQPPLAEQVEVNIPDDPTPLANVPQTGDYSPVWFATLLLSAMGLAVLTLKKREGEEN